MAASVHCKRSHGVSKKNKSKVPPPDLNSSPILSSISEKHVVSDESMMVKSSLDIPNIWPSAPQTSTQLIKSTSPPSSDRVDLEILTSTVDPHPSSHHDVSLLDKTPEEDSVFIAPPSLKPLPPIDLIMSSTNTCGSEKMIQHPSSPSNQTPSCSVQGQDRFFNCSQQIVDFISECRNTQSHPTIPRHFPASTQSIILPSPMVEIHDINRHSPPAPRSMQRRYDRNSSFPPPPFFHSPDTSLIHDTNEDQLPSDPDSSPLSTHPHLRSDHLISSSENTNQDQPINDVFPNPIINNPPDSYPESPSSFFLHQNDDNIEDTNLDTNKGKLKSFTQKWSQIFTSDLSWNDFCEKCSSFTNDARLLAIELSFNPSNKSPPQSNNHIPSKRPPHGRQFQPFNKKDAQRIRSLYNHSKKRAARKILADNSPSYTGSLHDAESFFRDSFAFKPCDTEALKKSLDSSVPSVEIDDSLFIPPSKEEICSKLKSASNTSAGPDKIEYRHLKRIDPDGTILSYFQSLLSGEKCSLIMEISHYHPHT